MFEGTKLLATSTSAVEWYKFHAHILFLSEVFKFLYLEGGREDAFFRVLGEGERMKFSLFCCVGAFVGFLRSTDA